MRFLRISRSVLLTCVLLGLTSGIVAAQGLNIVPVSGYEVYLGSNCKIASQAATCGATFTGWTGVVLPGGGWLPFPGTAQGAWLLQVNYLGKPAFGGSVHIIGGKWAFFYLNGTSLIGKVESGTVTWPADANATVPESGCKAGEALAQAVLSIPGVTGAQLTGCLHDLPAGSVIPPTVWGAFSYD